MAHEIKNPLTPIQLSAERIAKNFDKNSSFALRPSSAENESENPFSNGERQLTKVIKDGTETILREVSSLKSMVDEFSRFARLPNAKLENGKLNDIITHSVALYEDRFSDIEIVLSLTQNLPNVMLDDEQIRRVFVNLIAM